MGSVRAASLVALFCTACGAAAPSPASPAARATHPQAVDVMVIRDPSVFPALAARLPAGLDLTGRVLLLPGAWLPDSPSEVYVEEVSPAPTSLPAGVWDAAPVAERVIATVTDGVLTITFEHDVNYDGWCCSGIYRPEGPECDGSPPLPEVPADGHLVVHLFVVPEALAQTMQIARTVSICERP